MLPRSLICSGETLGKKIALAWSHKTAHERFLIASSFDKEITSKEIFCNQNSLHTNIQHGIVITAVGNRFVKFSFLLIKVASRFPHTYSSTGSSGTEIVLSPVFRRAEWWLRQDQPILDWKVNFVASSFEPAHVHQLHKSHSQFSPFSFVYKLIIIRLKEEKAITCGYRDAELPELQQSEGSKFVATLDSDTCARALGALHEVDTTCAAQRIPKQPRPSCCAHSSGVRAPQGGFFLLFAQQEQQGSRH